MKRRLARIKRKQQKLPEFTFFTISGYVDRDGRIVDMVWEGLSVEDLEIRFPKPAA